MRLTFLIILLLLSQLNAQELLDRYSASIADSIFTEFADTTSLIDTLTKRSTSDIDAIVFANATDSLSFDVINSTMSLYGKGEIKYKQTELKSGNIYIDFKTSELNAIGVRDTSDSLSSKLIDTPVLSEAGDVYEGTTIKYNFNTQRGFISMAKNKADSKTYSGKKVKKVDKKTFFVEDGYLTTCESDTPHTYFTANRMKVIQGDKIIASWLYMYIGGVPIPIPIPFGVFPNRSGRVSGLIAPNYGSNADQGFYLRNLGYFWAINDHIDFTLTGDYYFQGGYGFRGRARYRKRYNYNGNINGGYSRYTSGATSDPDRTERLQWNINVNHHQDFSPTLRLDAKLQFMTSDYLVDNSPNLRDQVRQDIVSNASISKRWEGSGTNLTMNYYRSQNLENGDITEDLPNATFTKTRAYPFASSGSPGKDQQWYEYIGYSYSGKFKNQRKTVSDESEIHGGFDHRVSIQAAPKIGFFNISPTFNYNSKWYNKRQVISREEFTDSVGTYYETVQNEIHEINFVRQFDFSLMASTKLYGMAQPGILGVAAFRHTFEPRLSYTYNPNFSEDKWGYYDSYTDEFGNEIRYDKFGNQIFGGVSSGERQSMSLSLRNTFEIKTMVDPTDTTSEQHKIKLLDLGLTQGYNFAADSLRLSDLNINFRTAVGDLLSFQGSTNFTFYQYQNGRKIDQSLISVGEGLARMTMFNINVTTNLAGDKFSSESDDKREKKKKDDLLEEDDGLSTQNEYIELYKDEEPDFSIPWNLNLTYNYNYSNPSGEFSTERSNLGFNLSFNLTQMWKITFRGSYDITNSQMNAPQITVFRDLHCWEAHLVWNPVGTYTGFRFEIRLKAPEFKDLKLSKTKDIYSGF